MLGGGSRALLAGVWVGSRSEVVVVGGGLAVVVVEREVVRSACLLPLAPACLPCAGLAWVVVWSARHRCKK